MAPIQCPKCKASDFEARSLQYELWRKCNVCKNEWSGGIGVAIPDYSNPPPMPGVPEPEEKPIAYTTPAFRDPRFNYSGDDNE